MEAAIAASRGRAKERRRPGASVAAPAAGMGGWWRLDRRPIGAVKRSWRVRAAAIPAATMTERLRADPMTKRGVQPLSPLAAAGFFAVRRWEVAVSERRP